MSAVSVDGVLAARADHGVELVGPLPPDSGWQARDEGGLDLSRFDIDWDHKQVTCPNGRTARNWRGGQQPPRAAHRPGHLPHRRLHPLPRPRPLHPRVGQPRHLTFRPRPQYETQHRILAEQATPAWRDRYAHRSGIEGTIAQASRRSDVYQARYRGLAKTHLQHVLTALAEPSTWSASTPGSPARRWAAAGSPASPDSDRRCHQCEFASRVPSGGSPVQHTLQGTGLAQAIGLRGGPSPHRVLTDPFLQASASMKQGSLAPAGLCCPCRHRYYDPLRLPGGHLSLPVRRL
jgi:hypothetical protein